MRSNFRIFYFIIHPIALLYFLMCFSKSMIIKLINEIKIKDFKYKSDFFKLTIKLFILLFILLLFLKMTKINKNIISGIRYTKESIARLIL